MPPKRKKLTGKIEKQPTSPKTDRNAEMPAVEPGSRNETRAELRAWLILAAVLILVAVIRVGLLDVPLERDEGEYAYAGQLILQGELPFAQAYNMKMPGIYAAYAGLLAVVGQSLQGLRVGLLLINAATTVFLFLAFRRRFDRQTALLAAIGFAVVTLNPSVHGFMANAEHFVLLPVVVGIWLLLKALDERRLWMVLASGLAMGLGFMMKQHGVFFVAFGGLYFLAQSWRPPRDRKWLVSGALLYGLAALIPFGLTCLVFWRAGLFDRFWFWTFTYASKYATMTSLAEGLVPLKANASKMWIDFAGFWLLGLVGLTSPIWDRVARDRVGFVLGLTVMGLLATTPGLYFRPHYFLFFMPALALLAAQALSAARRRLPPSLSAGPRTALVVGVALLAFGFQFISEQALFFRMTPTQVSRKLYWASPFPEAVEIARYIRENSHPQDQVAVLGSEPEIFFYSGRRSATGYIYVYALMEEHDYARRMQEEMIRQVEDARPKYVVLVNEPHSWAVREKTESLIFKWGDKFIMDNYDLVGRVDILPPAESTYHWGPAAKAVRHISRFWVDLYVRR